MKKHPTALTIAGSDSGGGAGLQADLKVFQVLGVHGSSAVTAVTVQNTRGVTATWPVPVEMVGDQIEAVLSDIGADAVKTGMLHSAPVVDQVVAALSKWRVSHLVVDPVMMAKSGHPLLVEQGVAALKEKLLPLAEVVTPNTLEAGMLTGMQVDSVAAAREAAARLVALGARHALVTGGHLPGDPVDVFYDGRHCMELRSERSPGPPVHGTGCVLSAALAGYLARGLPIEEAVTRAHSFVGQAIRAAFAVGGGYPICGLRGEE